eukprot:TCALIF_12598-PA protein Name:"Similar to HNRNPLL Heterogeneous nuclear ribonucleoprotein L-like (Homo sapiens)" AED:0.07 eAED:0.09 QI:0/0/0.5/1/0/0/2/693/392
MRRPKRVLMLMNQLTFQSIASPTNGRNPAFVNNRPNHILMVFVHNAIYPINTSILHRVVGGSARLVRAIILKKKLLDTVEAMMEFESICDASRIKERLDGAAIYTGCCLLEVHFAYERVFKLRVPKNCEDSWDFTVEEPASQRIRPGFKRKLEASDYEEIVDGARAKIDRPERCVLAVFELNMDMMSPERIFNLFCVYGDVLRVRFTKAKGDMALVEMSSEAQAMNVIEHLDHSFVFRRALRIRLSHQLLVLEPLSCEKAIMANGFPCFQDFSNSSKHRFSSPSKSMKNMIVPPSRLLHAFNLPLDFDTNQDLIAIFASRRGVPEPNKAKMNFPKERAHARSGFVEFRSTAAAVEALILCNHAVLGERTSNNNNNNNVRVLKLCFSIKDRIV